MSAPAVPKHKYSKTYRRIIWITVLKYGCQFLIPRDSGSQCVGSVLTSVSLEFPYAARNEPTG